MIDEGNKFLVSVFSKNHQLLHQYVDTNPQLSANLSSSGSSNSKAGTFTSTPYSRTKKTAKYPLAKEFQVPNGDTT